MRTPLVLAALAAATLAVPTRAAAQDERAAAQDERAAVLATVQRVFDGMQRRDTALLRSAFLPGARLYGMRTRRDGQAVVQQITEQQFAESVARDTRGEWLERAFVPEVRIEGTLATVWAWYDFHLGGEFSHCGVDAVQLLKTADGWRIVTLSDTFQRTECPERPAP
jgi:hypothetical protein